MLLLPVLPPRGDKSDVAKLSLRVGVSGSTQLKPADCRLAEAMSRLLAGGGGGVDGGSSTTIISGTSVRWDVNQYGVGTREMNRTMVGGCGLGLLMRQEAPAIGDSLQH